jgi:hypothetical protein
MKQLKDAFVGERLWAIRWVIENHDNPAESFSKLHEFQSGDLVRGSIDWNVTLEKINLARNKLAPILAIVNHKERRDQLQAWSDQFDQDHQPISSPWVRAVSYMNRGKRSRIVADELTKRTMTPYLNVVDIVEHSIVNRELTKVAVKLTGFRPESGGNPESLKEFVPETFAMEPQDGVYGSAIQYRRLPNNGVLLYSLGPDGQDDGGSSTSQRVYRGIHLSDWEFRSRDADRVKQILQQAGESSLPADLLQPYYWVADDADDISWRTPLPVAPLQELLERVAIED